MKTLISLRSVFKTGLYWLVLLSVVGFVSALVRGWFQSDRYDEPDPQKEFERAIENDSVEDVLARVVSIVEESGFSGTEVDEYATTDRMASDGKNLYYYYEVDPSIVSNVDRSAYKNGAKYNGLKYCSDEFFRSLLREGVTFHHYYNLSGSSKRFATVSINEEDCRDHAVTD